MKRSPLLALLLTAALFCALPGPSSARADNPPATRLAVVNLMKVFDRLDERKASEGEIRALSDKMDKEKQDLQKVVDDDSAALKDLRPESPAYTEAEDKLLKDGMELKAHLALMEARLTMEQRLFTMKIYKRINDTVAEYSKEKGIALVLVTEDADFTNARDTDSVLSKIGIRKVLYADSALDITTDLITRLNTAFATAPK